MAQRLSYCASKRNTTRIQIVYRHCLSFWWSAISIFELELKLLKRICCKFDTKCDKTTKEKGFTVRFRVADLRSILRYCRFIYNISFHCEAGVCNCLSRRKLIMKRKMAFALDFIQLPRLLMIILRKRYALVSGLTKSLTGSDVGPDRRSEFSHCCRETRKIFSEFKNGLESLFGRIRRE